MSIHLQVVLQKIDKLKAQLTTLADLIKADFVEGEGEDLDEKELDILRTAGVIAGSAQSKRKRRKSSGKHMVFAEDEEQGMRMHSSTRLSVLMDMQDNHIHFQLGQS